MSAYYTECGLKKSHRVYFVNNLVKNCIKVLVVLHALLFFSERLIDRWNRLPDSVNFTPLPCFKRSLDTVDFSLLS